MLAVIGSVVYLAVRTWRRNLTIPQPANETPSDAREQWYELVQRNANRVGSNSHNAPFQSRDTPVLAACVARHPGPAPWALAGAPIQVGIETWRWVREQTATILKDAEDRIRIAVGVEVCVTPVSPGKILLCATIGETAPSGLELVLVDVAQTLPLSAGALDNLDNISSTIPWALSKESIIASTIIPIALPLGKQHFDFPQEFRCIPGCMSAVGDRVLDNKQRRYHYILCPAESWLTIQDLTWFNNGCWESPYQWISRIVQMPGADSYIAEVVRGGLAELRFDGQEVIRWIIAHPFWMPLAFPTGESQKN